MYKQVLGTNNAVICFSFCPTGFTRSDGPPNECTGSPGKIIEYDLTYIERDFANLAVSGQNVATLASSQGSNFADTLPYKLRGAYGDGNNMGIHIPNLVLGHSFSVAFWILPYSFNSKQTLFSKDNANYSSGNSEDILDFLLQSDASLEAELYINGTNVFNGAAQTSNNLVSGSSWNWVGFKFDYSGSTTLVEIWLNDNNQLSYTSDGDIFLRDSSTSSNSWLFMTVDSGTNNEATPADAFHGFMYWFYMWNTSQAALGNEIYTSTDNCTGTCTLCSRENGVCLWTVARD